MASESAEERIAVGKTPEGTMQALGRASLGRAHPRPGRRTTAAASTPPRSRQEGDREGHHHRRRSNCPKEEIDQPDLRAGLLHRGDRCPTSPAAASGMDVVRKNVAGAWRPDPDRQPVPGQGSTFTPDPAAHTRHPRRHDRAARRPAPVLLPLTPHARERCGRSRATSQHSGPDYAMLIDMRGATAAVKHRTAALRRQRRPRESTESVLVVIVENETAGKVRADGRRPSRTSREVVIKSLEQNLQPDLRPERRHHPRRRLDGPHPRHRGAGCLRHSRYTPKGQAA